MIWNTWTEHLHSNSADSLKPPKRWESANRENTLWHPRKHVQMVKSTKYFAADSFRRDMQLLCLPKASNHSSDLSCSLHCTSLHLAAEVLYKATHVVPTAEFEMLQFCCVREEDHRLALLPRQWADRLPGLQLFIQPVSWKFPFSVWHFVRKATDCELEKPLGEAQPAAQSYPSVSDRVPLHRWCYSYQLVTVNWSAWRRFDSSKEVALPALVPGELHPGACTHPRGLRAQFTVN